MHVATGWCGCICGAFRIGVAEKAVFAIEAGVTDLWRKYVGLEGAVIGLDRYGESAPAGELFKYFGITAENVIRTIKSLL